MVWMHFIQSPLNCCLGWLQAGGGSSYVHWDRCSLCYNHVFLVPQNCWVGEGPPQLSQKVEKDLASSSPQLTVRHFLSWVGWLYLLCMRSYQLPLATASLPMSLITADNSITHISLLLIDCSCALAEGSSVLASILSWSATRTPHICTFVKIKTPSMCVLCTFRDFAEVSCLPKVVCSDLAVLCFFLHCPLILCGGSTLHSFSSGMLLGADHKIPIICALLVLDLNHD